MTDTDWVLENGNNDFFFRKIGGWDPQIDTTPYIANAHGYAKSTAKKHERESYGRWTAVERDKQTGKRVEVISQ